LYFKKLHSIACGTSPYRFPWFGANFKTKERFFIITLKPVSHMQKAYAGIPLPPAAGSSPVEHGEVSHATCSE